MVTKQHLRQLKPIPGWGGGYTGGCSNVQPKSSCGGALNNLNNINYKSRKLLLLLMFRGRIALRSTIYCTLYRMYGHNLNNC
jgi:hypothetical protein